MATVLNRHRARLIPCRRKLPNILSSYIELRLQMTKRDNMGCHHVKHELYPTVIGEHLWLSDQIIIV